MLTEVARRPSVSDRCSPAGWSFLRMSSTAVGAVLPTGSQPPLETATTQILAAALELPGVPDQAVALVTGLFLLDLGGHLLNQPPQGRPTLRIDWHRQPLLLLAAEVESGGRSAACPASPGLCVKNRFPMSGQQEGRRTAKSDPRLHGKFVRAR